MKFEVEAPEINTRINSDSLPKGTLVRFKGYSRIIYAMVGFNKSLIDLATGDTWSNTDFEVEIVPKGTKITITQE